MTETENLPISGAVTGGVRILLRLEGAALFAGATWLYASWGGPWLLYLALFLAPDLSFLGYLAGPKIGAWVYNAAHSTLAPIAILSAMKFGLISPYMLFPALIWLAHIGFDRALGYGLKYASGFGFTHLGRIGRLS